MKILLVGEYSRLHNSLKEGLQKLGHDVTIIASGDGFKNFPTDIKIVNKYDSGNSLILKKIVHRLTGFDISSKHIKRQILSHAKNLKGFDVVQLINESPFLTTPKTEIEIIDFFKKHNHKLFLLSCGHDYISVKYAQDKKFKYSILTPYFQGKISKKDYASVLKYISEPFKILHNHVTSLVDGIIASDIDYHIPLKEDTKYSGFIPNPINTDTIAYISPKVDDKIIIFHGINTTNYFKKGNDIFEEALSLIQPKFQDKIEIITTKDIPYKDYINSYNKAHIILDQVFSYDQGYNALEAMAKGKVVFTGAEQEWLEHYNLNEDTVAINALPDAQKIAKKLEWLIENPNEIVNISRNARAFIEKEHHYLSCAEKYLKIWND